MSAQSTLVLTCPEPTPSRAPHYAEEAQHSVASSEWFTPPALVDAARSALGGVIDIDPASCPIANTLVRAIAYCHVAIDGLAQDWFGNIWLNPPSPVRPWWERLQAQFAAGNVKRAVYLAYNIDTLVSIQGWTPGVLDHDDVRLCIVDHRIRFKQTRRDQIAGLDRRLVKLVEEHPEHANEKVSKAIAALFRRIERLSKLDPDELIEGDQPTHGSAFIGLGIATDVWREAFSAIGACR